MKYFILLGSIFLLPFMLIAQQDVAPFGMGENGIIKCGTVEYMGQLRQSNSLLQSDEEFEEWIARKMEEKERNGNNSRTVLTIPIIFHIIHFGDDIGIGRNVAQAQIQSQLEVLNEDFRRKAGTAGFNTDSVGADIEIEFCAALYDPNGNLLAEPGINRVDGRTRGWTAATYTIADMDGFVKPATIWDPRQYYNVWVASIGFGGAPGGLLGYAQFPDGNIVTGVSSTGGDSTDGVVILTSQIGRFSDGGRTLTHETGHWLGLRHIWGDGGCNVDDFCNDTPPSDQSNFGCNPNHISCGSVDMVRNYMDYSNGTCMNIFTQCQKNRMRAVLLNAPRRASLLESEVCSSPLVAPVASFGIVSIDSCSGEVQFADSTTNFPNVWFWTFGDGNTSTDPNPIHRYSASGTYTIRLLTNNNIGTDAVTQQITINVSTAASIDAGPDITACAGDPLSLNVSVADSNATFTWRPTNFLLNPNSKNPLFNPITDMTYYVTATVTGGCQARDTLNIRVVPKPILNVGADVIIQPGDSTQLNAVSSKTMRSWNWTPFFGFRTIGEDSLASVWVQPAQTVTYKMTAIDLDGCIVEDEVKVTVEGTPPLSIDQNFQDEVGLINLPYPNPAKREVLFSANFKMTGELKLSLYDFNGRQIDELFEGKVSQGVFVQKWQRPTDISNGLYFAKWTINGRSSIQKIQLK